MKNKKVVSEFALLARLRRSFVKAGGRLKVAIGDDTAVFEEKQGHSLLATTDMLVEGVHFTSAHSAFKVGQKAVASNVSDIAAMGGKPLYALVSVGLKKTNTLKYAEELLAGIKKEAAKYKVGIIGGDTVSSKVNTVNITLLGEASGKKYALRNGAKEGDFIIVTGELGNGAAELLNGELYIPKIHTAFAEAAVGAGLIHGMIDISDGLSSELHHLAFESGLGAFIDLQAVPVSAFAKRTAARKNKDAYYLALNGGEDYNLLFTAAPANIRKIFKLAKGRTKLTVLGVMRNKKSGVKYSGADGELRLLPRKGYDHFA